MIAPPRAIGLFFVAGLTVSLLVGAAEPAHGGAGHAGAAPGAKADPEVKEHKREMQADFIDFKRYDLAIYTLVVFVLMLVILRAYAWGPIMDSLEKRERTIQGAYDAAAQAKLEADAIRAQLQAEMAKANDRVRELIEEARKDGQRLKDELVAAAAAQNAADRERLLRDIEMARHAALQDLWSKAAELATLVTVKTIKRELTSADHQRLVDEALGELQTTLAGGKA